MDRHNDFKKPIFSVKKCNTWTVPLQYLQGICGNALRLKDGWVVYVDVSALYNVYSIVAFSHENLNKS